MIVIVIVIVTLVAFGTADMIVRRVGILILGSDDAFS